MPLLRVCFQGSCEFSEVFVWKSKVDGYLNRKFWVNLNIFSYSSVRHVLILKRILKEQSHGCWNNIVAIHKLGMGIGRNSRIVAAASDRKPNKTMFKCKAVTDWLIQGFGDTIKVLVLSHFSSAILSRLVKVTCIVPCTYLSWSSHYQE